MIVPCLVCFVLVLGACNNQLTYPASCAGDCVYVLQWIEWTPRWYNFTLVSAQADDMWLGVSLSDLRVIACKQDNVTSVAFYKEFGSVLRGPGQERGLKLAAFVRLPQQVYCQFTVFKALISDAQLARVHMASGQANNSGNNALLGEGVDIRLYDRYYIKGLNPHIKMILFHGLCMLVSYATFFVLSIFMSRYLKRLSCTQKWHQCYIALLLITILFHAVGLLAVLYVQPSQPFQFHRCTGLTLTALVLLHFLVATLKPHQTGWLRKCLSHAHLLLSLAIFLLSFSNCFTGLAQLTGLAQGTLVYLATYMFWIIVVGFIFSELLHIYYPVKIESFFTILKVFFVVIAVVVFSFGVSVPVILFVIN